MTLVETISDFVRQCSLSPWSTQQDFDGAACGVLDVLRRSGAVVSRPALVEELLRQVLEADPADDTKPWRQAFLNLADCLTDRPQWLSDVLTEETVVRNGPSADELGERWRS